MRAGGHRSRLYRYIPRDAKRWSLDFGLRHTERWSWVPRPVVVDNSAGDACIRSLQFALGRAGRPRARLDRRATRLLLISRRIICAGEQRTIRRALFSRSRPKRFANRSRVHPFVDLARQENGALIIVLQVDAQH